MGCGVLAVCPVVGLLGDDPGVGRGADRLLTGLCLRRLRRDGADLRVLADRRLVIAVPRQLDLEVEVAGDAIGRDVSLAGRIRMMTQLPSI